MFDYEKFSVPFKRGSNWYHFHNSGLQAQSVLYQKSSWTSESKVFLDPNQLSADGTTSLSSYSFTKCGQYFAYGISHSGSDWVEILLKSTATSSDQNLNDHIKWAKFTSITWTHDNAGFFYNRYPEPSSLTNGPLANKDDDKAGTETDQNINGMVYYHCLNTSQDKDQLIHSDPKNPQWMFGTTISDDGKYLILSTSESCDPVNKLWIKEWTPRTENTISQEEHSWTKIADTFEAELDYITNTGTTFFFKTNRNAPRYKVVKTDISKLEHGFQDVIAEQKDVLCAIINVNEDYLVATYMEDVKHVLKLYNLEGKLQEIPKVPIGTIDSLSGRKEDGFFFFRLSSFLNPGIRYQFHFNSSCEREKVQNLGLTVYGTTSLKGMQGGIEKYGITQSQEFYKSIDGTEIPMFIMRKKSTKLDGQSPTILYGYGGFNISITPTFSPFWIIFVKEFNGTIAVANIRGGGEYGEDWHKGGMLFKKQNCFDDFQAAAKYLITKKYTSAEKLTINGGSNGGLLVGACINQAPELFRCAIADVGVMDMLRFHKFTIGHAWKSDYGDPDKKDALQYLLTYSPLHTVNKAENKALPAVLLCTGDHDDRVCPLHSYKYISELQYRLGDNNSMPLMIRIETKAGHGAGKPISKRIAEATDKAAWIALACNVDTES